MPGSPLVLRPREFLRTGEQYGRHRKKAGSFLAPRILCEAVLSGVWEEPLKGNRRGSPGCFCSNRCRWAFSDAGFYLSGCCIWKKNALVLGRSPYQWQHEPCLFGWKKGGRHEWYSDRKQTTIWEYDRSKASKDHPTMKPVQLLTYPILNSSMPNGIVLDPFLGSGSTMIACEQTDRICRDIELDPKYVDVLVKRYIEREDEKTQDVYVVRDGQKLTFEEAAVDAGQGES